MQTQRRFSKRNRILDRARRLLSRWKTTCYGLASGVLVSSVAALLSRKNLQLVLAIIFGACVIIAVADKVLSLWYKRRRYDLRFANLLADKVDPWLSHFSKSGVAWGTALTIQQCPDILSGWSCQDVSIVSRARRFPMPEELQKDYTRYKNQRMDDKRFFDDGLKYRLVKNPIASSDSRTLVLEVDENRYSEFHFYNDEINVTQQRKSELIREAFDDLSMDFPQLLCMQAIIVTSDNRILSVLRSSKVELYPDTWSVSIEEQMAEGDLGGGEQPILMWARRMLREELGLSSSEFDPEKIRVLSVLLETHILNCNVCCLIRLNLPSSEFHRIIKSKTRADYEFKDWRFLTMEECLEQLVEPTLALHPTSGYRILLALLHEYGFSKLADKLFASK